MIRMKTEEGIPFTAIREGERVGIRFNDMRNQGVSGFWSFIDPRLQRSMFAQNVPPGL